MIPGFDADVAVIGAGPAGTAAAIELARLGRDTVLVDKARFPRDKCCGDGLTTGALHRLELLGLEPGAVGSFTAVASLGVRSVSGRVIDLPLEPSSGRGVFAAVARRFDLDAALVTLAREAGASVIEGDSICSIRSIRSVEAGSGGPQDKLSLADGLGTRRSWPEQSLAPGIEVTLSSSTRLRVPFVVAADGAWSPVRHLLGATLVPSAKSVIGEWHAFRTYVENVRAATIGRQWVIFDPALLPGYAWSFPLPGGRANVGACLRRVPGVGGRQLAGAFAKVLDGAFLRSLLGPDATATGPLRSWPIPAGLAPSALCAAGGRVLFAGDAARAADPFTGEGIAQALETGMAAARAIGESLDSARASLPTLGARAAQRYRLLTLDLVVDQRASQLASRALARRACAAGAVALMGRSPLARSAAARVLYDDEMRQRLLGGPRRAGTAVGLWRDRRGERRGPFVEPDRPPARQMRLAPERRTSSFTA